MYRVTGTFHVLMVLQSEGNISEQTRRLLMGATATIRANIPGREIGVLYVTKTQKSQIEDAAKALRFGFSAFLVDNNNIQIERV